MGFREKVVNGLLWSATKNWGEKALSFLIFLVLSRKLGPEAFGLVAMAFVFTTFAEVFLDQGFVDAIVQRDELDAEHLDTAFWISMLMGGLLMGVCIIASGPVAALYKEPRLSPILSWLSLSFLLAALSSTQKAILRRNLDFKSLAIRSLIATLISGIVCITMAYSGAGVWSLVTKELVFGSVSTVLLWRISDWRPSFAVSQKHFKDLSSFGINVVGSRTLEYFTQRSDDFLIGYFLGPVALGYYTVAYRLLRVLINLLTGITTVVAFSTFSRIQSDHERLRRAFYKVTRYTSLVAFPAFLGMTALAPEILMTLFGSKWAPSVPVMQILSVIGVLLSIMYFNGSVIKAVGKPSWQMQLMLLVAAADVIGFLLVVRWGIAAVAAAYVTISFLLAPVSFLAVHKLIRVNFRIYFVQFLAPLTASLTMVIVILGLKYFIPSQMGSSYLQLFFYVSVGAMTYLLVLGLIMRPSYQELLELVNLVWPNWKLKRV